MNTKIELSDDQMEAVVISLGMRICSMETGTVTLRANDAIQSGQPKLIKALSDSQKELIRRMEDLLKQLREEQSKQRRLKTT